MGFRDSNGWPLINEEQKIRIALSDKARLIIAEDMDVFHTPKVATFINTVFSNFRAEAKSSISIYMQHQELELDMLFRDSKIDPVSKRIVIEKILSQKKENLMTKIREYNTTKGESKLYHINDANVEYLIDDCDENQYYSRPGLYLRSILEEYCSLPFKERERIYRRDVYDLVERACKEKHVLKVKANYYGTEEIFYVYPYKILPDSLHTQSYLVCYSRKQNDGEKDKIVASFSMARIKLPTMLSKTFHLNKQEIANIENQITKYSPAYLTGKPERIEVRLTAKGKQSYQTRLYSRPEKIESLSTNDVYVFDCTQHQIFNYFFPFGPEVEIISPEILRNKFITAHEKALMQYCPLNT